MPELTITNLSFALVLTTLGTIIHLSFRFGVFMEQFKELKQKVRIHDQLLGIPVGAKLHTTEKYDD